MREVGRDVQTAWRNARRAPLAATVIILSLAFGIGAATSALVVRNALFYNPPPLYAEPAMLSRVQAGRVDPRRRHQTIGAARLGGPRRARTPSHDDKDRDQQP